ncbi:MAG: ABC-F type ribosomal protection protein [Anaerolineaceae bacterium]|nr:ABC-F type ribosomal protection protein [Anaerolineaceae bacterium]
MLQVHQISKFYGVQMILENITFSINPDDRVGLVGPNGSGKSTLLQILTGEEPPDQGTVFLAPTATLGYLAQGLDLALEDSVGEYIRAGIPGFDLELHEVERLAERMGHDASPAVITAYGEALSRFELLGGYAVENRIETVLSGLGLQDVALDDHMNHLSGGQRTRVGLARLLVSAPSILLLDEPTNHLDIEALEWLEEFLGSYRGAVLVVSHDRRFLDHTVRRILELDPDQHTLREYAGGYSEYEEAKTREIEKQWGKWKDQQVEIRRLGEDIRRTKEHALSTERSTNNDHMRRLAKKVAQRAKSKEKRLQRYLAADSQVDRPDAPERMHLQFAPNLRSGQVVIQLKGISMAFGEHTLFQDVNQDLQYGERIALVGPNGSGKTTLLRLIMNELPLGRGEISIGPSVRIGYMPQQQEILDPQENALETIQHISPMSETEIFNFLHYFLIYHEQVRLPTANLSYGERARLMLARMVVSGANCLLLDEPVNHLDIPSRQQFETALEAFPGTILVSVHDRAFIDRFATSIWYIKSGQVRKEQRKNF